MAFDRAPVQVRALFEDTLRASSNVLIAAGPLPADPVARMRHEEALVPARVAAAAHVVRAAVPPLLAPALPADPAPGPVPTAAAAAAAANLPLWPHDEAMRNA